MADDLRTDLDQLLLQAGQRPVFDRLGRRQCAQEVAEIVGEPLPWAERGSRPPAPRDQRREWAYIFGAVCPRRDIGAALVLPYANAHAMNLHLEEISCQVTQGSHAVLLLDGAGWHQTGGKLRVPKNVSLLHPPPYSPELNPVENIWQFLRQNRLGNRVFESYAAIVDACCAAWNALVAEPGPRFIRLTDCRQHIGALGFLSLLPQSVMPPCLPYG